MESPEHVPERRNRTWKRRRVMPNHHDAARQSHSIAGRGPTNSYDWGVSGISADVVLRAMTDDGALRVIAADTSETVRGALAVQHGQGDTARHFADLLTAAVLFRETMAPQLRVQTIIKGVGGLGSLVADADPSGRTRGLIQLPPGVSGIDVGAGAMLRVMRSLPGGRIQQGVVRVPDRRISDAFMVYMQRSEQSLALVGIGSVLEKGSIKRAGGYILQLLPGASRQSLVAMVARERQLRRFDEQLVYPDFSPAWLLDVLLEGLPFTHLGRSEVRFDCWCSEVRVLSALATLSRTEIEQIVKADEVLDITCDYCGKPYRIAPAQLRGLLDES